MSQAEKPHILYLTNKFPDHDSVHGRAAQGLMTSFLSQGYTLTVIAEGPDRKDVWYKGQYRYIGLGLKEKLNKTTDILSAKLRALTACKNLPASAIVIFDANAYLTLPHMFSWAKKQDCPTIYWAHAVYPEAFSAYDIQVSRYFGLKIKQECRQAMKHSDLVVVESLASYKYLSHTGINTRKIKIIPSWDMALKYIKSGRRSNKLSAENDNVTQPSLLLGGAFGHSASCLKKLSQDRKFRVLHAGELQRNKSLHALLAVAQKLDQDNPEIEFLFSGYGPGMDYLYQERTKRQIENIRLMPLQPKQDYLTFLEAGDLHLSIESSSFKKVVSSAIIEQAIYAKRPYLVLDDEAGQSPRHYDGIGEVVDVNDPKNIYNAITKYRYDFGAWFAAHERAAIAHDQFSGKANIWDSLIHSFSSQKRLKA